MPLAIPSAYPQPETLSPRATAILTSAALAIAAAVRFWGIDFGLPHTLSRPDEEAYISVARRFMTGQLNPDFFVYPPLYSYGLTVLYFGYYLWGLIAGVFQSPADLVASWHSQPEPFFLLSRLQSATLGTLTVLLIYRMGLRVFDRETALVSAFLLALAFLHARDSHFGTADVAMTFLVLLSLHFLIRAYMEPVRSYYVMAGALGGLATATKYNAVLLFVPLAVSVILHVLASRGARVKATFDQRSVLFTVPFVVAYIVAAPYTFFAFDRFVDDIGRIQQGLWTGIGFADLGYGWTYHLTMSLRYGVGIPLLVASLVGLVVAVGQDAKRTLLLCAFPIVFYCVNGSSRWVFARYMVPVVPFLCLLAGVAIVWAGRRVSATRPVIRALVMGGLTIAVVFPSASSLWHLNRLLARTDSRVVAAQWVQAHVPAGSSILQNGGIYGGVQFDTDRYVNWSEVQADVEPPVSNSSQPGQPDWIILHESPLGRHVEPAVAELVSQQYKLVESVKGSGTAHSANVFDLQDSFYVPYAGFRDVARPGPDIWIYRNRD